MFSTFRTQSFSGKLRIQITTDGGLTGDHPKFSCPKRAQKYIDKISADPAQVQRALSIKAQNDKFRVEARAAKAA